MTIEQVAAAAGVSIATVSRFLNSTGSLSAETRDKVLRAMEETGYRPAAPKTGRTGATILMMVPRTSNPFYSSIIDGALTTAARRGYHVLLDQTNSSYKAVAEYDALIKASQAAGLLILDYMSDKELIDSISLRCPTVQCCEFCEGSPVSYVTIDDFEAAKTATSYLISTGRRRIALLNGSPKFKYARQREAGFISALDEAGIPLRDDYIIRLSEVDYGLALSAAMQFFRSDDPPDAIFAISDIYAAAVIKAARRQGLDVPKDVAVVGFDNTEIAVIADITTIHQPRHQMGLLACDLLIDRIEDAAAPQRHVVLDTELIVRDST